jgi:hypothetical protein
MPRRIFLAIVLAVLPACMSPFVASAGPVQKYVLKHPGRESCKAGYVRHPVKVKARRHGKTVKVSRPGCVYVAGQEPAAAPSPPPSTAADNAVAAPPPAPTNPTPPPTPPAGPTPTSTDLNVDLVGCHTESFPVAGNVLTVEECAYNLSAAVKTTGGSTVPSAQTTFIFTNVASPGATWTIDGNTATISTSRKRFMGTESTALGDSVKGPVAEVEGNGPWEVSAVFEGSPEFGGSQSAVQAAP